MEEVQVNQEFEAPKRSRKPKAEKPKLVTPNLIEDAVDHHGNQILLTEGKSKCRVYLCWWGEKININNKRKTRQKSVIHIISPKDYQSYIAKHVDGKPNSWDDFLETKYNEVELIHDPEVQ